MTIDSVLGAKLAKRMSIATAEQIRPRRAKRNPCRAANTLPKAILDEI
jgi:hypothetical protein